MPAHLVGPLLVLAVGMSLLGAGRIAVRGTDARPALARRLAGAREVKVGSLLDVLAVASPPGRALRVTGRIRCSEPMTTPGADRLVVFHRDVEVRITGGSWQNIERLRETRSFDLWDHDGWLTVDPAQAAEPLVVLPHVWQGSVEDLDDGYQQAVERLRAEGRPAVEARSISRMISVSDKLLVLAEVRIEHHGNPRLYAPSGGFVISNLELDEAMRLLGGAQRGQLLVGMGAAALGAAVTLAGSLLTVAALVTGR